MEEEYEDRGIILATLPYGVSRNVACIVLCFWGPEDKRLFLLPRYLFSQAHLLQQYDQKRISKNEYKNTLRHIPSPGVIINFWTVGQVIDKWSRAPRNAECGPKLISYGGLHGPIQFKQLCVISDDTPERRIHFQWFNEFLKVPQGVLHAYMPYVPYCCLVSVYLDISNFNDYQPIMANAPTFRVEFDRIINVEANESNEFPDTDSPMQWLHAQAFAHWHHERFPAVHPYMPKKMYPQTDRDWDLNTFEYPVECIVIDEKEAYCYQRPYARCFFGFPAIAGDFHFVPGRILCCYMYYSLYNHCYVIDRYHPRPDKCGSFGKGYKCVGLHCENPMKTRMKNGYRQFLAWVKLNNFGHFYCSYGISFITDPKNIMHGRFPLGTDNTYQEHEDEPGVGIRCWLRYNSGEETFRWTIDELFEANDSQILHKEFSSCGYLLNKRGSVYCPHVCNFPLQISENVKCIGYICKDNTMRKVKSMCKVSANPEVGDWFSFRAKFDPITERYMIFQIDGVDKQKKLPCVLLPGEKDTYAFRIPLGENFYTSNNLLVSFENENVGLVEDVDKKVTAFVVAWAQTHKSEANPRPTVPIWCRENPDLVKRKTPLCVLGIMKNPATDMPAIQQEDRGEEEEYGTVY